MQNNDRDDQDFPEDGSFVETTNECPCQPVYFIDGDICEGSEWFYRGFRFENPLHCSMLSTLKNKVDVYLSDGYVCSKQLLNFLTACPMVNTIRCVGKVTLPDIDSEKLIK
jgi:hypothetical protein